MAKRRGPAKTVATPTTVEPLPPPSIESWNEEDLQQLESRPGEEGELIVAPHDWTVKTIIEQIKDRNLDLQPRFQRRNAWKDDRRSKLVESLILGFPVPQIVLAEMKGRRREYIVIDGKQRLLALASIYGLPDFQNAWPGQKFLGLTELKELNGVPLDDFRTEARFSDFRRQLDNADIRSVVIKGIENDDILYDIFYRLNTGSVALSTQELRHAIHRGPFSDYLLEQTNRESPIWTILSLQAPDERLRDAEILLRLMAFQLFPELYRGNQKKFLDDTVDALNSKWQSYRIAAEAATSQSLAACSALTEIFGPRKEGRKYKNGRYESSVNRSVLEVQVYYLANPDTRQLALNNKNALSRAYERLCETNPEFIGSIESTTKSIENYHTRYTLMRSILTAVGARPTQSPF